MVLLVTLATRGVAAVSWPAYCPNENNQTLTLPVAPHLKGFEKTSFRYTYRYFQPPGKPTSAVVIYIGGGPGISTMMSPVASRWSYGDYGWIQTDLRGIGCNPLDPSWPDAVISSALSVEDILALVRKLGPQKYILYGVSYGTVVATEAAARARSEGLAPPAAVVLESPQGRAFHGAEWASEGFIRLWEKLRAGFTPDELAFISSDPPPFGLSAASWGNWLSSVILFNTTSMNSSKISDLLEVLARGGDTDRIQRIEREVAASNASDPPELTRAFRAIVCHELRNPVASRIALVKGHLRQIPDADLCAGLPMDHPFDAGAWQIPSPIYYFSGELDPVLPPWQAQYHFDSQYLAPKTWVRVQGATHAPLRTALDDCEDPIWRKIFEGKTDFESLQPVCRFKFQVVHRSE